MEAIDVYQLQLAPATYYYYYYLQYCNFIYGSHANKAYSVCWTRDTERCEGVGLFAVKITTTRNIKFLSSPYIFI